MNKESHTDISFHELSDETIAGLVNNKRFNKLDEIGDSALEIENSKSRIKLDVPIQIGFFVLEYAKLLLLQFYYDFLLAFIPFHKFALIESDTDSMYFSLSEESLFLAVPIEKRADFVQQYDKWFAKDYCDAHKDKFFECKFTSQQWLPDECCKTIAKFDSRTVGKFHTEWEGQGVIALSSKCYYCIGNETKYSSKGLSKRHNHLTEKEYLHTLTNQKITHGVNRGFRVKGNSIFTYVQRRKGLNYMYGKRIVSTDHITTYPTQL